MKKILINGQWQGGADISTFYGAREIERLYLSVINYEEAEVFTSDAGCLPIKNNIVGYSTLKKQMEKVFQKLEADQPDKLFAIGGGCDADFPSIAYMNQRYNNLKILYFDAHGDINAPEESESKLFYGMPLRCLMKSFDNSIFPFVHYGIKPEQIIHIGGRELDDTEVQFMNKNNIQRITVDELVEIDFEKILADDEKIYIHLDLDVLEPQEFSHIPLPVAKGVPVEELKNVLNTIKKNSSIVGFGIFEYKSCGQKNELLKYLIQYGMDF